MLEKTWTHRLRCWLIVKLAGSMVVAVNVKIGANGAAISIPRGRHGCVRGCSVAAGKFDTFFCFEEK